MLNFTLMHAFSAYEILALARKQCRGNENTLLQVRRVRKLEGNRRGKGKILRSNYEFLVVSDLRGGEMLWKRSCEQNKASTGKLRI